MASTSETLGTVEASEQLIRDLYLDLRVKISRWAAVTQQTAQARMGYIGQHLTSVVTGFPGGRSGARGYDLVLPEGRHSEIKTCYRVDQLGACNACEARVASIEEACPKCGSTDIDRKDDSKWLIGIRNDDEFADILSPEHYYLVLFDFLDLKAPDLIRGSIWRVDPQVPGFALCMVDYYRNIRASSTSKAPFNLWPFQLKFDLMKPQLIYRSIIAPKQATVRTEIFPGRNAPVPHTLSVLGEYAQSRNLTQKGLVCAAERLSAPLVGASSRATMLRALQKAREAKAFDEDALADALAVGLYRDVVEGHVAGLPDSLRGLVAGFIG